MRTLKPPSGAQHRADRDEGAVLVIVAVIMVALLGIGALVIDLGALHVERRELQNGADAAALAIAQDCAGGNCGTAFGTAKQFADFNAKDKHSNVDDVCGFGPGLQDCDDPPPSGVSAAHGWVRVTTSTQTPDDGDQVNFLLAPVMGALTGKTVHATAEAAWGPLGGLATIPLAISECEYDAFFDGDPEPGVAFTVYSHTSKMVKVCDIRSPGKYVPGGFGWLKEKECVATVSLGPVLGDSGSDFPCDLAAKKGGTSPLESWLESEELLLPVFSDSVPPTKVGGEIFYTVVGFVSFKLQGYRVSGAAAHPLPDPPCKNPERCISGIFKDFTTLSSGEFGGGNFGVTVVKMVG